MTRSKGMVLKGVMVVTACLVVVYLAGFRRPLVIMTPTSAEIHYLTPFELQTKEVEAKAGDAKAAQALANYYGVSERVKEKADFWNARAEALRRASAGQASVGVFYIPLPPDSFRVKKEMEPVMRATKLGVLPVAAKDVNVYVLLDAINTKLKENHSPGYIMFAEPSQVNAAWSLASLKFLVDGPPPFAADLNGKDLVVALSEMTLWDVYHSILRGGYGFQEVERPYGILLCNG